MAEFELDGHELRVRGVLDEDGVGPLRTHCAGLVRLEAPAVKIDLSGVESINSASIGAIMAMYVDLRTADRRMELVLSPQVKKVLDLVGLTTLFGASGGAADA